jgi:hypothetical protein
VVRDVSKGGSRLGTVNPGLSAKDFAAAKIAEDLRRVNAKLLRQLDAAKNFKADLVKAVHDAAREAAEQLSFPPVPPPFRDRKPRKDDPETAIMVVSDWQLGKKTPTYSTEVCAKRAALYSDRVRRLTDIQRADRPIRRAKMFLLGDLVEGEMIFPGQSYRIDASLFRQVMLDGPEILGTMIRDALGYFDEVEVCDVIGNHGRLGRRGDYHPESNADAMLYEATRKMLGNEPRLIWSPTYTPGERAWYRIVTIGQNNYFLFHGDQLRGGGFAGLPFYGFARAINNWGGGVIKTPFRYAVCGHYHQLASIIINNRILWVNGSLESDNEWLREELKAQSPAGQWLLFAHDRRGVTVEHRVWLE